MDIKEMQKFRLIHLLNSVITTVNVYKEKELLRDVIQQEDYDSLLNTINEFIGKYSSGQ